MTRTVMHVDMNAFFASVEQQSNPQLREKPVAVIGAQKRTVVTTASYQARDYGIKTGMTLHQAHRLCPRLILVSANNDKYIYTCSVLARIFMQYTPLVEVNSIDEAFLDLTGSLSLFPSAETIALCIKNEIRTRLGLTCSIGIAPNKLLAKLASDLKKPDGLVIIPPEKVGPLLENLPVQELCGIGPYLAHALNSMGIRTCGDLGRACRAQLRQRFGVIGDILPALGRGIDSSPVIPQVMESMPRSVSHSLTFPSDVSNQAIMKQYLLQLSEMVGRRLRGYGLQARTVVLTVRYADFTTFTRSLTAVKLCDDGITIYHNILVVLNALTLRNKVRLLGVKATNLAPRSTQLHLFQADRKNRALTQMMDRINDRYGESTISRATLLTPFPFQREKSSSPPSQRYCRKVKASRPQRQ